jgi:signal transduction histidine kinase
LKKESVVEKEALGILARLSPARQSILLFWKRWWSEISLASRLGLFLAFTIFTVTTLVAVFQSFHTRASLTEVAITRNQLRFLSRLDPLERAVWHLDFPLAESLLRSAMEGEEALRIFVFEPSGKFSLAVERQGVREAHFRVFRDSALSLSTLVPKDQIDSMSKRLDEPSRSEPLHVDGLNEPELARLASPLFHRFDESGDEQLIGYVVQDFSLLPLRQSIRSAVSGVIALYTCVALLIFASTFFVVRRALLVPLQRLAFASLDASRGIFNPVRLTSGQDALGVLQRNFNTLMEETRRQFDTYEWLGFEGYRLARAENLLALRDQVRTSFTRFSPCSVTFDILFSEECFSLASQGGLFVRLDESGQTVFHERMTAPQILRSFSLALPVDPSRDKLPKAFIIARDFPFDEILSFTRRVSLLAASCGHCINTLLLQKALTRIDTQRNELQTLLGSVPVGILLLDSRLVIQREYSRHVTRLLAVKSPAGLAFDEVFLRSHTGAGDFERIRARLLEVFGRSSDELGESLASLPSTMQRTAGKGELALFEVQWVPVWNAENRVEKVLVTLRDVTELEMSRIRLTAKSRLASLGQMAGGIAHEINNPLAVIQGYAMTLRKLVSESDELDVPRVNHAVARIEATVERAARIVRSLRTFSRDAENDPLIHYSVARLIEEVLDLCRERFRNNNVELTCDAIAPNVLLLCRPVELGQVLLNLLNNAFDALVASPLEKRKVSVRFADDGECMRIKVCDNGPGVHSEYVDQIFFPFFTTKEIGKGTGLGLPISLQIVKAHGGRLWHEPQNGETCFVVELKTSRLPADIS